MFHQASSLKPQALAACCTVVESIRFGEYIPFNLVSNFYVANTTDAPAIGKSSNVVELEL
jgi:hypothetical protein